MVFKMAYAIVPMVWTLLGCFFLATLPVKAIAPLKSIAVMPPYPMTTTTGPDWVKLADYDRRVRYMSCLEDRVHAMHVRLPMPLVFDKQNEALGRIKQRYCTPLEPGCPDLQPFIRNEAATYAYNEVRLAEHAMRQFCFQKGPGFASLTRCAVKHGLSAWIDHLYLMGHTATREDEALALALQDHSMVRALAAIRPILPQIHIARDSMKDRIFELIQRGRYKEVQAHLRQWPHLFFRTDQSTAIKTILVHSHASADDFPLLVGELLRMNAVYETGESNRQFFRAAIKMASMDVIHYLSKRWALVPEASFYLVAATNPAAPAIYAWLHETNRGLIHTALQDAITEPTALAGILKFCKVKGIAIDWDAIRALYAQPEIQSRAPYAAMILDHIQHSITEEEASPMSGVLYGSLH